MEIHLKRPRDVIDALAGLLELERSAARQQQQVQEQEVIPHWNNDSDISLHIYSPDLFEDAFAAVCLQDLIEVCANRLVKLSFDCCYTRPWKQTQSDRLAALLWKLPRQNHLETIRFMSIQITSPLHPFTEVLRRNLPRIQQFSFQCAFDTTTAEYAGAGGLYEMAHALSQASPKRIEFSFVRWTEEPPDKVVKFATLLVCNDNDNNNKEQALEALVLRWLPVGRAELVDPGALSGFFHAAETAPNLQILALGSSQLSQRCIQDVARILRHNHTLLELSVEVKPGTFMDPLLDALESSTSVLERLRIGVHAVGRQCVFLEALGKLLDVLQTKNYSLKAFNVYSQFGAVDLCWDSEYQGKLEGIECYVNLNAKYPQRRNLLQDETFTVQELLEMLPIATDDPDHESISAIYGLLLTNPGFWLASI